MCRTQGGHTALPWSKVFICITLDPSCTDANNSIKNGNFTSRNIEWMPYCFKNDVDAETLICAACKTKNYTRKQCRIKSRHRYLPWSTVYVVLSCDGDDDARSSVPKRKDEELNGQFEASSKRRSSGANDAGKSSKRRADGQDVPSYAGSPEKESDEDEKTPTKKFTKKKLIKSDDVRQVDKSRTFLVEVDENSLVIKVGQGL